MATAVTTPRVAKRLTTIWNPNQYLDLIIDLEKYVEIHIHPINLNLVTFHISDPKSKQLLSQRRVAFKENL
jgi:hypothetical protein